MCVCVYVVGAERALQETESAFLTDLPLLLLLYHVGVRNITLFLGFFVLNMVTSFLLSLPSPPNSMVFIILSQPISFLLPTYFSLKW